jgi:hypothetical protein
MLVYLLFLDAGVGAIYDALKETGKNMQLEVRMPFQL